MAAKRSKNRDGPAASGRDSADAASPADAKTPWSQRILNQVLLVGAARLMTIPALLLICFAAVFLVNVWQYGPKVLLDKAHYREFTTHVDAPIVESWLALEVDVASIRHAEFWRASAKASPCAVVQYAGTGGPLIRRAFCGNRLGFSESYKLQGLLNMAPDVPFDWARDDHGFVVPEIRLDAQALQWLSTHPANTFMHRQWPANTALEWLRLEEDRPVEAAVVGWSTKPAAIPIAFDPRAPADSLPTGIVQARQQQDVSWIAIVVFAVIGLPIWIVGTELLPLLSGLAPLLRTIVSVLLLGTVPWWMQYFPDAVGRFSTRIGSVVADMFDDMNTLDRMIASEPVDATLADGSRLTWRLADSAYADTLGRYPLVRPTPAPFDGDAALAALAATVTAQTRAMNDVDRATIFAKVERDKRNDLTGVGIVFVPAAREALTDAQTSPDVRRAARRFLTAWVTAPRAQVDRYTPGYQEWARIERSLADVPVPEIANMIPSFPAAVDSMNKARR